ncbi:MAG: methyltransferase domain-containing protein [Bowdeniella nasicola]|nr:methyltransferase domain-containing protein [Bowdeniella nasicola]
MSSTPEQVHGQRQGPEEQRMQGHWLLAKLGKRVLRPGGIELTRRLIAAAKPTSTDRIVEFGPGVGRTASMLLACNPREYVGVDPNTEGTAALNAILKKYDQARLVAADAKDTGLADASYDLVVGEAMLSMQTPKNKAAIAKEAFRILAPGGRYAIHELGILPEDATDEQVAAISKSLSGSIRVGAKPLTTRLWTAFFEEAGFQVEYADHNPMHLLEPKRIISDEGFVGAMRFFKNVATNPPARARIRQMRTNFREHRDNLQAVAFVAVKPRES